MIVYGDWEMVQRPHWYLEPHQQKMGMQPLHQSLQKQKKIIQFKECEEQMQQENSTLTRAATSTTRTGTTSTRTITTTKRTNGDEATTQQ